MADGFLGRWSRRKIEARDGALADEPARDEPLSAGVPARRLPVEQHDGMPAQEAAPADAPAVAPPPTMEDVRALTAQSDFSRFAARDVAPEVKSAALKKLFADPHYNVMDGMDVYVDDYSKADPLPGHMLRQLAGAAFLRLVEEPAPDARDVADNPKAESVAQSGTASDACQLTDDADPDLRLQQDDATAAGGTGPGAG